MADTAIDANALRTLEARLMDPAVRRSREAVEDLLAEDFREFGGSGRVYDRGAVIAALREDPGFDGPRTIADFDARALSPVLALVTYRIVETGTLRSSIWRNEDGRWRMIFHQGTPSDLGTSGR